MNTVELPTANICIYYFVKILDFGMLILHVYLFNLGERVCDQSIVFIHMIHDINFWGGFVTAFDQVLTYL